MARCQAEELAGAKEHKGPTTAAPHGQSHLQLSPLPCLRLSVSDRLSLAAGPTPG